MSHDRKLVLGGVSLTRARLNKRSFAVMNDVRDSVEEVLIATGYFVGMPFQWIALIVRYGLVNESEPHIGRIDKTDGELEVAIEVDVHDFEHADHQQLRQHYLSVLKKALDGIARHYKLNATTTIQRIDQLLA
jgi:hypothetical protein